MHYEEYIRKPEKATNSNNNNNNAKLNYAYVGGFIDVGGEFHFFT